jgi:hypothetical protein
LAIAYGQVAAANQALSNKEKLLGLHRPDNTTFVQNNNYNFDNLTVEEAKNLLIDAERLIKKDK